MENKKISVLLFMCSIMGYISSTLMFLSDNIRMGALYLCLASMWLILAVVYLKKKENNQEENNKKIKKENKKKNKK